jgi:phage gpG-like protein
MSLSLDIDVFGVPLMRRRLNAVGARAADLEPALESVADDMRRQAERAFGSRGLTSGTAWPPLQPDTIARKLRDKRPAVKGHARKTLHATEKLRKSLTDDKHVDDVSYVDNDTLIFGTDVPYAPYHQTGTSTMKARPPVRMRANERSAAVRKVSRYITTGRVT